MEPEEINPIDTPAPIEPQVESEQPATEETRDARQVGKEAISKVKDRTTGFFRSANTFINDKIGGLKKRLTNTFGNVSGSIQAGAEKFVGNTVIGTEAVVGGAALQAEKISDRASEIQKVTSDRIRKAGEDLKAGKDSAVESISKKIEDARLNMEMKGMMKAILSRTGIDLQDDSRNEANIELWREQQLEKTNNQANELIAQRRRAEQMMNRLQSARQTRGMQPSAA
jgi:hypothetical protein